MTKRGHESVSQGEAKTIGLLKSAYNLRSSVPDYIRSNAEATGNPPQAENDVASMLSDLGQPASLRCRPRASTGSPSKKQKVSIPRTGGSWRQYSTPPKASNYQGQSSQNSNASSCSTTADTASVDKLGAKPAPGSVSEEFPFAFQFPRKHGSVPSPAPSITCTGRIQPLLPPGCAADCLPSPPDCSDERSAAPTQPKRKHRGGKKLCGSQKKKLRPDSAIENVLERTLSRAEIFFNDAFSVVTDSNHTTTGWSGKEPPARTKAEIRRMWDSGRIKEEIGRSFFPVPYEESKAMLLVDNEDGTVLFRSWAIDYMKGQPQQQFHAQNIALLASTLRNPRIQRTCQTGQRGKHFPLIIGHQRQYGKAPELTRWHKEHFEAVQTYLEDDVVKGIIKQASRMVEAFFPGVAARFRKCAKWHLETYGIQPMFGLFWNYCINACFPGQRRVHCKPHADSKNIVGVCCLFIYEVPNARFNHKLRTWLVIWEAGVVVELPPWVYVLYPSSLLFHFNIDVHDIEFRLVPEGEKPNRRNSIPLQDGDDIGRGSLVLFNQSSMYQSSETGFPTVQEAKRAGLTGTVDFGACAQTAFENCAVKARVCRR